jgi:hypothetical protein
MKVNQFTPVPKVKVPVTPKVLMVEGVLVTTKPEVMADIIVALMPRKVEPNVLDVMTNGKPKLPLIKVFELSDD